MSPQEDADGKGVRFDPRNAIVDSFPYPDRVELVLNIPLEDGAIADTRVTLGAPSRFTKEDGTFEYKMGVNTTLSVTQTRKPTHDIQAVKSDGLEWEIPMDYPGGGTALLLHEPKVKEFLTAHFRPGGVFIDVGANVGGYSVRAAAAGMRVRSFEPNPENARALRRNAEINQLSIEVNECALGEISRMANISPNGAISRITNEGGIGVPMRTLDSFELDGADLMKIDVEGYELEVLRGATQTLRKFRPRLVIEMHDWVGAEREAGLFEILSSCGYTFEYLDKYAHGRHLKAEFTY